MVQPESSWSPREQEQQTNAAFFETLLNERLNYAYLLSPIADHNYEASYIETAFHYVPTVLLDHVDADNLEGSVSLRFEGSTNNPFSLKQFEIQLLDGSQIELKTDWLSTTVLVNGEEKAMYLDTSIADDVMRCLLPPGSQDISSAALAYALFTHGQRQSYGMKVVSEDAQFTFCSEETADDSSHLMEIEANLPDHASGKTIVLRATISEGLLRATHGINSGRSLDIAAVPALSIEDSQLYVEHIIGRKAVRVDRLTQVHREIITTTMEDLLRVAAHKRRADKNS